MEVHSDVGSFAVKDSNEPEQNEMTECVELDEPMTTETRRGGHKKTNKLYNRFGDYILFDKIKPDKVEQLGEYVRLGPGQRLADH